MHPARTEAEAIFERRALKTEESPEGVGKHNFF